MKWSETIAFREPLRTVRLLRLNRLSDVSELLHHCSRLAHQAGVIAGERRLSEQLIRQRAELAGLQTGVLQAMRNAVPQVMDQAEKQVIELTFAIAQKIVGDLPISAEMVEATVRDALGQVKDTGEVRVRLHPDDHQLLEQHAPGMLTANTEGKRLHFEVSESVSRGGCLVETRAGVIDSRRETRWESVRRALVP